MYIGVHVKYPLFLSRFNETCIFSTVFSKIPQITKFHKNPSWGSKVHADRRTGPTGMTKPTAAFRNFANAPKKGESSDRLLEVQVSWLDMQGKCQVARRCHWRMGSLNEQTFTTLVCSVYSVYELWIILYYYYYHHRYSVLISTVTSRDA